MNLAVKTRTKTEAGERAELRRQIEVVTDELDLAVQQARIALDRFRACLFDSYSTGGRNDSARRRNS